MKLAIIAGGKGTRLGELSKNIPKALVPIGCIPIIEHQLTLAKRYGVAEVAIFTGYLGDQIKMFCEDGRKWGMQIHYFDEPMPLGTAGALKLAEAFFDSDFLVFYGDVMLDMNIDLFMSYHRTTGSDATLLLHPNNHPYDSDLAEIDDSGRILRILPKPHPEGLVYRNLVNAAVYAFSPRIFQFISKGVFADFGKHVFPEWLKIGLRLYGYCSPEYIKDMGTLDRLDQVNQDYASGKIGRLNLNHKQKAIFLDRDGTINKEVNLLCKPEQLVLFDDTVDALRLLNKSEFLAIIITNQPVVARNLCTLEELDVIHKHLETLLGNHGVFVDAIYYCPHHPDRGYPEENPLYKIECECRKPKPGMILQAAEKFNIELTSSFFIGDREIDMECAQNAGVHGILLSTSTPMKTSSKSQSVNLLDAVRTVLDRQIAVAGS